MDVMFTMLSIWITGSYYLIFVTGLSPNQEIMEQGRMQYQLLKDLETLPKYGTCWKSAIEHLNTGCRSLTEDSQSDIALHITNCFLEMSGHEMYNCELDKKRNLRAICISSMSDRAFNVYTEFYTHTQNMCWFLQGQVWQEIISESTMKVGRQLQVTAANQEELLLAQKESLELQSKMLKHGQFLEQLLEDLYTSFQSHQDLLRVLSGSISKLQAWIIGEISWLDSIIFYFVSVVSILVFTGTERVQCARFPTLLMLLLNFSLERLLCSTQVSALFHSQDVSESYSNIYNYVWISRYSFIILAITFLIYSALVYEHPLMQQHKLLHHIGKQNENILEILNGKNFTDLNSSNLSYIDEIQDGENNSNCDDVKIKNISSSRWKHTEIKSLVIPQTEIQNKRYNLRSNTPIK